MCHEFISSTNYKQTVSKLDNDCTLHFHIGYSILLKVREDFLHEESETVLEQSDIGRESQRSVCDEAGGAARAKVRYLAGYVFGRLLRNSRNRVDANLYRKDPQNIQTVQDEFEKLSLLLQAITSQHSIAMETEDIDSIREIERKQNLHNGLINVNDSVYKFCLMLCNRSVQLHNEKNLFKFGKNLHLYIVSVLVEEAQLWGHWTSTFGGKSIEMSKLLFKQFIEIFVRVLSKQFVHDIKELWEKTKKDAHRKEILKKKENKSIPEYNVIDSDTSEGKVMSKLTIKTVAMKNHAGLAKYTISEIREMASSMYGLKLPLKCQRKRLTELFLEKVLSFTETTASQDKPVQEKSTTTQTQGGSKKAKVSYSCGHCKKECTTNCVCCDKCDTWFHSQCLHITDLDNLPDEWYCPQCL